MNRKTLLRTGPCIHPVGRLIKSCAGTVSLLLLSLAAGCGGPRQTHLGKRIELEMIQYKGPVQADKPVPTLKPGLIRSPDPIRNIDDTALKPDEANKDIDVKIVEKWFNANKVFFTVLFRNVTGKGARKRLYVLGYDKNGRLTYNDNKPQYFQPREQILMTYNFNRSGNITKWIITVL